jgi:hypothetical protein
VTKILNGGEGLSDELTNGASHLFILLPSFHLMVLSSYYRYRRFTLSAISAELCLPAVIFMLTGTKLSYLRTKLVFNRDD